MKEEPLKVTFKAVVRDGVEYIMIPIKDYKFIHASDNHHIYEIKPLWLKDEEENN